MSTTVYGIQQTGSIEDTGITFNHYGIVSIRTNPVTQMAIVSFMGYKDFSSRLSGASPINGTQVDVTMKFSDITLPPLTNPTLSQVLASIGSIVMTYAINNAPEFSGATIVSQGVG